MKKKLEKIYITILGPNIAIAAGAYLLVKYGLFITLLTPDDRAYRSAAVAILILTALLGIALPLIYKIQFASRMKKRKTITPEEFLRYEIILIIMASISPYMATGAIVMGLTGLHLYGVIIMALYGPYGFYPSQKRIALDERIFRVTVRE